MSDEKDILFIIRLHSHNKFTNATTQEVLEYLQYTNPSFSYMCRSAIYLVYDQNNKHPFLRSNIASDIIAHLSSELSMWIVKNTKIDLRTVGVNVLISDYEHLLKQANAFMESTNYEGVVYEGVVYEGVVYGLEVSEKE